MDLAALPLLSLDADPAQFSAAIGACFRGYGFAMVADHGIDFTLGIWEHDVQPGMQPSTVGLTAENIGPYSYAALRAVLEQGGPGQPVSRRPRSCPRSATLTS